MRIAVTMDAMRWWKREVKCQSRAQMWVSGRAISTEEVRDVMQWQVVSCKWQLHASGPVDTWGERLKTKLVLPRLLQMMCAIPGNGRPVDWPV